MPIGDRWWRRSVLLRAFGIGLVVCGLVAIRYLVERVPLHPHHVTALAMVLASIGFTGCSFGGALSVLGAHIHDQVEIAERWRRRPLDRTDAGRLHRDRRLDRATSERYPPGSDRGR